MIIIFYALFCIATFLSFICYIYMVNDRVKYENLEVNYKSSKLSVLLMTLLILLLSIIPIINIFLFLGGITSISGLDNLTREELKEKFKLKEC